jgi:hypothetical protein
MRPRASVYDYLIDHSGFDWPQLLAGWARLLPAELTVWLMNRFGDLFLVYANGSVHLLDVGCGTVERVAESREDFRAKIDEGDTANQWLMIPLVDRLVGAGMIPGPGECYGYKLSPVLGGDYVVNNIAVLPVHEHYGFNAELHEQIKDLPNGAEVRLVPVNVPGRHPVSKTAPHDPPHR